MSTIHFSALFRPRSIALIGASAEEGSVGSVLARNMLRSGFDGPVMPVHPTRESIEGVIAYPAVDRLPVAPDLGVIATRPDTVPALVRELGARGARAVVVISAGFAELGGQGRALQQEILAAAQPYSLRVVGPNCVGVLVPRSGLNASFAHLSPRPGSIAFVSQSGAVLTSVIDWAAPRDIGFSHLVSLGDMADVDFGDLLDHLANDSATSAVLMYVEGITHARKFMSAARAAARMKPVIVVKAGRFEEGAQAAASHTGALAGADPVYDAAFARAGLLRVYGLEELFDSVETLATTRPPAGDRLAILTNGGGMGVLAVDALVGEGGCRAELAEETHRRLDADLPPTWSRGNPVDIIGDAGPRRYVAAYRALDADAGVDAILAMNCPTAVASSEEAAAALVAEATGDGQKPLFTSWVGDHAVSPGRKRFVEAGIPTYDTPRQAVRAFMAMVEYRRSQELLMETPPSVPDEFRPDREAGRRVIAQAIADERAWLTLPESMDLLAAYGIPSVQTEWGRTPEEAAASSRAIGGRVALKISSQEVPHKSDVGGVALDVEAGDAVRTVAEEMQARVEHACPEAKVDGFVVQPMVSRGAATELIVGASKDPVFGPVLLFGHGGTAVERLRDHAVGLPPINLRLAAEMIGRTRVRALLEDDRGGRAADRQAIALTLVGLSQLVLDFPEIAECEANPLLATPEGVVVLDARVRIGSPTASPPPAIRPYPSELEEMIQVEGGRRLLLRPIRPEDEPSLRRTFDKFDEEEKRLRFFSAWKHLSHEMAARFTQLDYDREMALALTDPGPAGETEIYGVVRVHADPNNERGEYAIIVRHDFAGRGLGRLLMERIIHYARGRGIRELFGDVLGRNHRMLGLCRSLGFESDHDPVDPSVVRVRLPLSRGANRRE